MYFRLSLQGVIASGERWSINPTFDPDGELPSDFPQASLNAMVTAALAVPIPTNLKTSLSTAANLASARLEVRDSGTDALMRVAEDALTVPVAGSTGPKMPPQCALVISTRTNTPGARGRGRLYWPAPGLSLAAGTMRISAPTTAQLVADAATYFKGLQDALFTSSGGGAPWQSISLCVRSRANKQSPHVTRLEVGDVVDTQRRRRDTLIESRDTSAFPPS